MTERRALHILLFAFELENCQPQLFMSFDSINDHPRMHTRHHNPNRYQFDIFRPTKSITQRSISDSLQSAWNALPSTVHQMEDKHILSSYLLTNKNSLKF